MKHHWLFAPVLAGLLLTLTGCPSLWKYNYGPALDEDPAYLSVPDPERTAGPVDDPSAE